MIQTIFRAAGPGRHACVAAVRSAGASFVAIERVRFSG